MPRDPRLYDAIKRVFDVCVSSVGLIATAPIQACVAVVVLIAHGRPVLFRQRRPGKDGRAFGMVKFRTMLLVAEGRVTDEERLTAAGRFLRSTSLDELPTLWNVLKGDMSIVGPRPLLVEYLERYSPEQARRHEVRPGITGLAQVQGRNAVSWAERFRLDVEYVDSRSLALDVRILVQTVGSVLRRTGITEEGCATMSSFAPPAVGREADAGA